MPSLRQHQVAQATLIATNPEYKKATKEFGEALSNDIAMMQGKVAAFSGELLEAAGEKLSWAKDSLLDKISSLRQPAQEQSKAAFPDGLSRGHGSDMTVSGPSRQVER